MVTGGPHHKDHTIYIKYANPKRVDPFLIFFADHRGIRIIKLMDLKKGRD